MHASDRDSLVHGSLRPGAEQDPEGGKPVTEQEVLEWAEFMKARGIKRVVGLLGRYQGFFCQGRGIPVCWQSGHQKWGLAGVSGG